MKNSVLLATTLLVLAAGASATAADIQTQAVKDQHVKVCRATDATRPCQIMVRVSPGCRVTVNPYFLIVVPRRIKGSDGMDPIRMEWTIEGGTFASENAIRWKSPEGSRVFTPVEPSAKPGKGAPATPSKEAMAASRAKPVAQSDKSPAKSGIRQLAFNNSGTKGVYNYGVKVVSGKGESCPELDPTGINDIPQ